MTHYDALLLILLVLAQGWPNIISITNVHELFNCQPGPYFVSQTIYFPKICVKLACWPNAGQLMSLQPRFCCDSWDILLQLSQRWPNNVSPTNVWIWFNRHIITMAQCWPNIVCPTPTIGTTICLRWPNIVMLSGL